MKESLRPTILWVRLNMTFQLVYQEIQKTLKKENLEKIDEKEVIDERESILRPLNRSQGISYMELEKSIRQVMTYYMGYRRNQKGMEIASMWGRFVAFKEGS